ncbi:hypothetical protein ABBQ32_009026 [Trebouxia sp. C0010 RCD-2024]
MSFSPIHSRSPVRRGPSPAGVEEDRSNINTIFVGNLAPDSDERSLREFFGKYGYVTQVKVVMDQETGKPRGFGFVTFEDVRDAQDAVSDARGKALDGNILRVNVAKYPRGGLPHERFDRRQGPPMRGRGMGRYNSGRRSRSRSLGRYSPGRYSPGRYSPNTRGASPGRGSPGYSSGGSRSRSRSFSRGRSGSPLPSPRRRRSPGPNGPAARNTGWGGPPPQVGRPLKRRAGRSPSPSGSFSGSYSSYSSSGSDASRPPAAAPPAGAPRITSAVTPVDHAGGGGNLGAELAHAKRREAEATTRVAALEAKLKSTSSVQGEMQASVQELSHRLQKQDDLCSHYRKWLTAVAECAKALTDSKAAVATAEAEVKVREDDLTVLVAEAASFVEKERARASKRARRHRDGRPRSANPRTF